MHIRKKEEGTEVEWQHDEYPSVADIKFIAKREFKGIKFEELMLVPGIISFYLVRIPTQVSKNFEGKWWFHFERRTLAEIFITTDFHFPEVNLNLVLLEGVYVSIRLIHACRMRNLRSATEENH